MATVTEQRWDKFLELLVKSGYQVRPTQTNYTSYGSPVICVAWYFPDTTGFIEVTHKMGQLCLWHEARPYAEQPLFSVMRALIAINYCWEASNE